MTDSNRRPVQQSRRNRHHSTLRTGRNEYQLGRRNLTNSAAISITRQTGKESVLPLLRATMVKSIVIRRSFRKTDLGKGTFWQHFCLLLLPRLNQSALNS